MERELILEVIANSIYSLFEKQIEIKTHFKNDLGMDSLDKIELILTLEKELDIEIQDEEIEECHRVSDLIELIANK